MDAHLTERLRSHRNLTGWWQDWGVFVIELTDGADVSAIPRGYELKGRTLRFYGSCQSPYAHNDDKIRVTLAALSSLLLLKHADVKWMWRCEPTRGAEPELRPLWVNEAHRPK